MQKAEAAAAAKVLCARFNRIGINAKGRKAPPILVLYPCTLLRTHCVYLGGGATSQSQPIGTR